MNIDQQRIRQAIPFAVPVVLLIAGWLLLVRPATAEKTSTERELAALRPRLESVRATLLQPPPPALAIEPAASFERQVTEGDPGRVLEALSRLAPRARYRDLSIDATGDQVIVGSGAAPQVAGAVTPDPRFMLFGAQRLSYVPITMSFVASYADVGELLWRLRDLGTVIELRSLELRAQGPSSGDGSAGDAAAAMPRSDDVRASLTLFAYGRMPEVAQASQVMVR